MRTQQEEYTDHKVNVAECNNLETHQLRAISEWRSPITTPHRKDTINFSEGCSVSKNLIAALGLYSKSSGSWGKAKSANKGNE